MTATLDSLPREIIWHIFNSLPTCSAVPFTATCKKYRTDKIMFKIVCERLGLPPKYHHTKSWTSLASKLSLELPKHHFPYNFAEKNLADLPARILTTHLVDQIHKDFRFIYCKNSPGLEFSLECRFSTDGVIAHPALDNFILGKFILRASVDLSCGPTPEIYKMKIHYCDPIDNPLHLSPRGHRIMEATAKLFNDTFTGSPKIGKSIIKHRKYYIFCCSARKPYLIFLKELYATAIHKQALADSYRASAEKTKKCSLQ